MRRVAYGIYLLVPALVFLTLGITEDGLSSPTLDMLKWLPANYLLLAAPQLLWLVASLAFRLSPAVTHAGFIAATMLLVSVDIFLQCCTKSGSGLWVLYYWPLAAVAMLCAGAIVAALNRQSPKKTRARHET